MDAISHAQRIISWEENLPNEDIPPPWMWPFEDELIVWFDSVESKRKGNSSLDSREQVPMMKNELI